MLSSYPEPGFKNAVTLEKLEDFSLVHSELRIDEMEPVDWITETILVQDGHGNDFLGDVHYSGPQMDNQYRREGYVTIDIVLTAFEKFGPMSLPHGHESSQKLVVVPKSWTAIFNPLFRDPTEVSEQTPRLLKVVLPTVEGFVSHSTWIQRRLLDCDLVEAVVNLKEPRSRIKPFQAGMQLDVRNITDLAAAAILVKDQSSDLFTLAADVEVELENRLSSAWISAQPIPRQRLAVVDGRRSKEVSSAGEGVFRAAASLDVGLVILDNEGHWLQSNHHEDLRDGFIPIDMSVDEGLADRIVNAIRNSHWSVDGIVTWTDKYLLPVAKAAEILGHPTSPSSAIAKCVDKVQSRSLQRSKHSQLYTFASQAEFEEVISRSGEEMVFPLVLKPRQGTSSEGVFKVRDMSELREVVDRNFNSSVASKYGSKMILETFVTGPEVDCNLTLINGEVVFSEISDDFPGLAENSKGCLTDTVNTMPSGLPESEKDILRTTYHELLTSIGIKSGIFHIEARVSNSTMEYGRREGLLDLQVSDRKEKSQRKPEAMLMEINARMPGNMGTGTIERLYGIDYYSLYLLFALGDHQRLRPLTQPYKNGPQYAAQMLRIPATKGGIWEGRDACEKLLEKHPDLQANVSSYRCLYRQGMMVPDPETDITACVAFFHVYSRIGRKNLLAISERILSLFEYEIAGSEPPRKQENYARL